MWVLILLASIILITQRALVCAQNNQGEPDKEKAEGASGFGVPPLASALSHPLS